MEPSKKSNKKWIIFGIIIAVLAFLIAIGPILVTLYMKHKYVTNYSKVVQSELMIKVKGVLKQSSDGKSVYLVGENGFFYALFGDKAEELMKNIGKKTTVFGNIYEPEEEQKIDGNSVRMRIEVVNMGFPNL
ncbi:MAG: hypothetical protein LBD46_04155 [Endomicrobium sp.]|jgi:hypothetical protein|nr:hypothetical protein [Endomicrobium sp.]